MIHYKNIMVAFDGSADSVKALQTAEELANGHDAQLSVVYVNSPANGMSGSASVVSAGDPNILSSQTSIDQAPMPMEVPGAVPKNDHSHGEDNIGEHVMAQARKNITGELNVHFEILIGKPAAAICKFAEENTIDLIVIGKRGFTGIKKLFMGSVSKKVTNDAECSVFVVK